GAGRLYGDRAAEVIGRWLDLLLAPGQECELEQIRDRVRGGQSVDQVETTRLRKDGSPIDVSLTFSPMRNENEDVVAASVVARDISARVHAEQALRRSEESYRLLFERHPAPMWLYDPETLRFLAVSEAAVATYRYSYDEFRDMTIDEIRPTADREAPRGRFCDPSR